MSSPCSKIFCAMLRLFQGKWLHRLVFASGMLVGLAACGQLLRLTLAAWMFPMELEVREGYTWLYVLAMKAGVSIYDHSQVAMTGQVYGPIDPIVKYILSLIFPFIASQGIVRFFVPIVPLALIATFLKLWQHHGFWRWPLALLSGSAVFVGLINLLPFNHLAGRPEVLATVIMATQAALTISLLSTSNPPAWIVRIYALLPVLAFFTNTRHLPAVGAMWSLVMAQRLQLAWKKGFIFLVYALCASAGVLTLLVFTQFGGDLALFDTHFYRALYQSKSGAVAYNTSTFQLFPDLLMQTWSRIIPVFLPVILSAFAILILPVRRLSLVVRWTGLVMVVLTYVATDTIYQLNINGGNIHYFSPYVFLAWWFLLLVLSEIESPYAPAGLTLALVAYLALVPIWNQTQAHVRQFAHFQKPASDFRSVLSDLYQRDELMSEGLQLFKDALRGSITESASYARMSWNDHFYSEAFYQTVQKFFDQIQSGRYRYFLIDGIQSEEMWEYVTKNKLRMLIEGPAYDTWNGPGGCYTPINCNRVYGR